MRETQNGSGGQQKPECGKFRQCMTDTQEGGRYVYLGGNYYFIVCGDVILCK